MYQRLQQLPESEHLGKNESIILEPEAQNSGDRRKRLLLVFAFICAIVSSALSFITVLTTPFSIHIFSWNTHIQPLNRPNPYVNLDKILRNMTRPEYSPVYTYSMLVFQVETSDALRALREEGREYYSKEGTVYPDDRHFVVSPQVSTVLQFRARDFGLERCVLRAVLPNETAVLNPAAQLQEGSVLDVWRLDSAREISRYDLDSRARAPGREAPLASFAFDRDAHWESEAFDCPAGSFFTFEFSCAGEAHVCHVEFWQNRESPNGVHMVQFDSNMEVPQA